MKSNRKSPIWPYLVLLFGLFLLSITAPRGWQIENTDHRQHAVEPAPKIIASRPAQATILRPQSPNSWGGAATSPPVSMAATPAAGASLFQASSHATNSTTDEPPSAPFAAAIFTRLNETAKRVNSVVESFGGEYFVAAHDETPAAEDATFGPAVISNIDKPVSDATSAAAEQAVQPSPDVEVQAPDEPADESGDAAPDFNNWPYPEALTSALEELAEHAETRQWASATHDLFDRLATMQIDDEVAIDLLGRLRQAAKQPMTVGTPKPLVRLMERTQLDLLRRVALWQLAAVAARQPIALEDGVMADAAMLAGLRSVDQIVAAAPVGQTWREYLLLERAAQLAAADNEQVIGQRRDTAQRILSRMNHPRLTVAQRDFLGQPEFLAVKSMLRRWAVEQVSVGELMHLVERYEETPLPSLGRKLALQATLFTNSRHPMERQLGAQLKRLYQNANLRLVVSAELLNRLAPQPLEQADRVNETIAGVPARGFSTTATRLGLRLFPAPGELHFRIEADGTIDSQTASTSGPVTLYNAGQAKYFVGKMIAVGRDGVRVGQAIAEADDHSRLMALETDFDGVPLVGALVRNYAISQRNELLPQAKLEVEAKVAAKAAAKLDAEVNARVAKAEADFRRRILAPLKSLGLMPTVIELSTTAERATARLRLAADDQTGAHTARPLAMSSSLASLQVHESALNNALDRLSLGGRTFTLPELREWIAHRVGRQPASADELPEGVVLTFADDDPVRIHCIDGRIELTLAFAELQQGRRVWYDVEALVSLRPQADGLRLELVRAGPIELLGEAYAGRPEIVLRGIFAKVFPAGMKASIEPPFNRLGPVAATLRFDSTVVDNGWISLTVADRRGR
jgi:hypothetical protein